MNTDTSLPRVLLIEDDASIRRFVALALDEEPITLHTVANVADALAALRREGPFRLVFTDLMLPDGSGQEVLQAMADDATLRAGARVVVFSAGLSAERRAQIDGLGVDEVLAKPASVGQLLQCVSDALRTPVADAHTVSDPLAAAVERYFAGNRTLFDAYRQSCLQQFVQDRATGDAAAAARDLGALRRLAHSLKTVLQTLGHDDESRQARLIENDAAEGDMQAALDGWAALGAALGRLSAA